MTPNDKLPEETYNKVLSDAVAYDKERKMQVAYYDGATAWAGWKVRFDELMKEHADLNLALAAMLNGYQNLSMYQKEWFTVPKDLIDSYTKMVLEYDKAIKIPNDGK